mmetsp:Transcript_81367/g.189007  ORF Transcript_81367/g.189007 Transcript_81367/m.189007 type:complete len:112 (+) Transcript_81367:51-386(+)
MAGSPRLHHSGESPTQKCWEKDSLCSYDPDDADALDAALLFLLSASSISLRWKSRTRTPTGSKHAKAPRTMACTPARQHGGFWVRIITCRSGKHQALACTVTNLGSSSEAS